MSKWFLVFRCARPVILELSFVVCATALINPIWIFCRCPAVPYVASSTGLLYERIREAAPVQLPEGPTVSGSLAALLRELLDKNPNSRMTLADVRQLLESLSIKAPQQPWTASLVFVLWLPGQCSLTSFL
jgi:hypothetical protein